MRLVGFLALPLLLLAACGGEPSPTPPPASPALGAAPTPAPGPAFAPGPVILPTVAIPTPSPTPASIDPLSNTLDTIGSRMTVLRGLFAVKQMDRELITRDELKARLRKDFEEDREDIKVTQALYATLGILNKDTDLFNLLLSIYGEDVLGFFDTEAEKLFVVKDAPEFGPNDAVTYAHEFVHGLQQQHFDIHATRKALEERTDRLRAFRALVEGDATLSQSLYMFQHLDEGERTKVLEEAAGAESTAFNSAPHVIQRAVTFPYDEGPQFVLYLYFTAQGWKIVNEAFADPPQSTEHILHPDKYLQKEAPVAVELPDLAAALGDGWTQLRRDTLGEFLLLSYLETDVPPERAAPAAEGWGGDSYVLLKGPQGLSLLASRITWDTEADAGEFFRTFLDAMRGRTGAAWNKVDGRETSQLMMLPKQAVYLTQDRADTLLIFAPDEGVLEKARTALQGM